MKIVAAIPTRGIVLTACMSAVLRELSARQSEWGVAMSAGHPIPEAHNLVVEQALKDGADYVWLVEEDVVVPPNGLQKLLEADGDIVAADVPSRHVEGLTQIGKHKGKIYYVHTGCTLVKKEVFEKLPEPWFDNKYDYNFKIEDDNIKFERKEPKERQTYGGQDIHFSRTAIDAGFSVKEAHFVCKHGVIKFDSQREHCHEIKYLDKITNSSPFQP